MLYRSCSPTPLCSNCKRVPRAIIPLGCTAELVLRFAFTKHFCFAPGFSCQNVEWVQSVGLEQVWAGKEEEEHRLRASHVTWSQAAKSCYIQVSWPDNLASLIHNQVRIHIIKASSQPLQPPVPLNLVFASMPSKQQTIALFVERIPVPSEKWSCSS